MLRGLTWDESLTLVHGCIEIHAVEMQANWRYFSDLLHTAEFEANVQVTVPCAVLTVAADAEMADVITSDKEVERIAMQVSLAYERTQG